MSEPARRNNITVSKTTEKESTAVKSKFSIQKERFLNVSKDANLGQNNTNRHLLLQETASDTEEQKIN